MIMIDTNKRSRKTTSPFFSKPRRLSQALEQSVRKLNPAAIKPKKATSRTR